MPCPFFFTCVGESCTDGTKHAERGAHPGSGRGCGYEFFWETYAESLAILAILAIPAIPASFASPAILTS